MVVSSTEICFKVESLSLSLISGDEDIPTIFEPKLPDIVTGPIKHVQQTWEISLGWPTREMGAGQCEYKFSTL